MKSSVVKLTSILALVGFYSLNVSAQDDDGIYGDIFETPVVETSSGSDDPLDGYSTVDDYYPEGGYTQQNNPNEPFTETYVDEDGNTIINNNYYGDYIDNTNDFEYASRINRFHRNNWGWDYYDPFFTNMYWYTYDPFLWGTSIYAGAWRGWGFNVGWGWNRWNRWNNWGWGGGFGSNNWGWNGGWGGGLGWNSWCWGGGWNNWGWGGGLGWNNNWAWNNGFNAGYWNGFNDGLIAGGGGYFNTYDLNSGFYYGNRGSAIQSGTGTGNGIANRTSFAQKYNDAARQGQVHHANRGNVLGLSTAKPVQGNLDGYQVRGNESRTARTVNPSVVERAGNTSVADQRVNQSRTDRQTVVGSTPNTGRAVSTDRSVERIDRAQQPSSVRPSTYQRSDANRNYTQQRQVQSNIDRSRVRTAPNVQRPTNTQRQVYERGNDATRYPNRQGSRQVQPNRGSMYQDMQRTRPSTDFYQRGNTQQQQRANPSRQNMQNQLPAARPQVPSRNYQPAPSRNNSTPSRVQPSRSPQPTRNMTPRRGSSPSRNIAPSRGSSPSRGISPSRGSSPSRSISPSGGSRGGSFSAPSRGGGSRGGSYGGGSRGRGGN